jgi:predicted RNA polymerase sigma factor
LKASETWHQKGVPPNPVAWLYKVAKQKALTHFRRDKIFAGKVLPALKHEAESTAASAASAALNGSGTAADIPDVDFSTQNIRDSQLQMMFAICTPAIASEAQIGLALRILCGFGIDEIAEAFLTSKDNINKRLFRAKTKLRTEKIRFELPGENEIQSRLDNVLHIIYLLFNEGYYSSTHNQTLRKDLCLEALRLGLMLIDNEKTNTPRTNALLALMCFHISRFDARKNHNDEIILYDCQDTTLWNEALISRGNEFLDLAARGDAISSYHLEAGIAFWNCRKGDSREKWENILYSYDLLLQINFSPTVALNRVYALYKAKGKKVAIPAAESLQYTNSHFYWTLLGELYKDFNNEKALAFYERALAMARTPADKQVLMGKIAGLSSPPAAP